MLGNAWRTANSTRSARPCSKLQQAVCIFLSSNSSHFSFENLQQFSCKVCRFRRLWSLHGGNLSARVSRNTPPASIHRMVSKGMTCFLWDFLHLTGLTHPQIITTISTLRDGHSAEVEHLTFEPESDEIGWIWMVG